MALKMREDIAIGGPDGGSSWLDEGDAYTLLSGSHGGTTTFQVFPMQTVARPDQRLAGGIPTAESLVPYSGAPNAPPLPIQRLNGAQISFAVSIAASTTTAIFLVVLRSIDTLGAQIAAAGGALTSLPLTLPLSTPLASGQTFELSTGSTVQQWTTSAAVKAGATSIPVNSQTPSGTYPAGTQIVFVAGNGGVFGWVYNSFAVSGAPTGWPGMATGPASGQTGLPAFPMGASTVLPALPTAWQTLPEFAAFGYVLLFPGDVIAFCIQCSSATYATPNGNCQPLMA